MGIHPGHPHGAGRGSGAADQKVEQGAFAAPCRADQSRDLPGLQLEIRDVKDRRLIDDLLESG